MIFVHFICSGIQLRAEISHKIEKKTCEKAILASLDLLLASCSSLLSIHYFT